MLYKEVELKNPMYVVKLDNGVELQVYEDHVESSDGEKYHCVEKEVADDVFEIIGWRKD